MARRQARPAAVGERRLVPERTQCLECGGPLWLEYCNQRTVTTLDGPIHFTLHIRRCQTRGCALFHRPYRPEAEGAVALPQAEFGLDVIAFVGARRYADHRSVPEIHRDLRARGVAIAERSVTNLVYRYEELVALRLADQAQLRERLLQQGRVLLALDGLQPDVGHEVLWVLRDCLSGEVLLARSLLSATEADLAGVLHFPQQAGEIGLGGTQQAAGQQHFAREAIAQHPQHLVPHVRLQAVQCQQDPSLPQ